MKPLLVLALFALTNALKTTGSVKTWNGTVNYIEDWDYVKIRPHAYSFWWLYAVQPANHRPLILWLQGGPGASSSGFGNIEETGPKDLHGNDRMSTWLQVADLVYVDNPVGAGFSYVDDTSAYTKNVQEIGSDLMQWALHFFTVHPEYKNRPFYIFTESYGGKMGAEFARRLTEAQDILNINFAGVGLGDSWISAMDYVNTWGPYLYQNGFLDTAQLKQVTAQANKCQKLMLQNKLFDATICWGEMEDLIGTLTGGVSWYNIMKISGQDDWSKKRRKRSISNNRVEKGSVMARAFDRHVGVQQMDVLTDYMNTVVRQKLGIIPANVQFGTQSGAVFKNQYGDFMTPNYDTVDKLLKHNVKVIVFNGNMDLICDTAGTEMWMSRLTWPGLSEFQAASKTPFSTNSSSLAGFYKEYKNLNFYTILNSGHMVAHDAEEAAIFMLQRATTYN